ncbi:5-formyltetrahydrofolate cyclo-ligase [Sphingomonas corticis]|jgi:5-formyltetrahydrofolate cyclo-ligase|uniref:5-formyltetrahydrofolate cyclo-ligase n=1 Tax=Sphingomonas corticis TaxID=2722791 RepID=A0ABX1CL43_9SPHN|nr:5-formyltetrahydrofolate cyclo-ligase [Sphingomonas corticis]NJR77463.1 5-formyltetrahydrofolate cyclo-ligase [Sphingomonas corticis]
MTDKDSLRATLRARRRAASGAIPAWPPFVALLSPALVVASYVPVGGEADPAALERAARAAGCTLALPHVVDRATPLAFLAWDAGAVLTEGPFGLRQPPAHHAAVAPDVVLTPLVGFDRQGNRLGQGAGHYDRAFAAFPDAHRIGIALAVQETDQLAPDPWDVPLHAIATDREWIVP